VIVLRGGRLCDPGLGGAGPADVYLAADGVRAVEAPGAPAPPGRFREVPCAGLLVVPGPIDTLCRADVRPDPWREDLGSLCAAAAAGGYTALLAYTALAEPGEIAALRSRELPVRLYPVAALSRDGVLCDLGLLADAGAAAWSDWPGPAPGPALLRRALEYGAFLERPVVVAAEEPSLGGGGMAEGALSFSLGLRGVPEAAETLGVLTAAALRRAFGGRLHLAALSAASSLPLLQGVTASVTAHHLGLTEEAVDGYRTAAKLSPPLRTERDRRALLLAAAAGRVTLASGHAPALPAEKECEYDYAAFGASAVETALPLALSLLGASAFVRAASLGPARAFGLPGGTLRPGSPADAAVFAPDEPWTVDPAALRSRGRATPLAGRRLGPRPVLTCVGGRATWADPRFAGVTDA
jgi:dihydroorotase